ncbi:hypothetical protein SAMN05216502_104277 [Citrobacter amalonaticus]|uniref:hypothetical protein n=1 Tax=Citrobacter amalonaticus TaxID=35703 RepID=UPI0008EE9C74|nr:hypothetical protein [Citrobacter amalonaticus]SFA95250.1 hypothetical protein SAMN05216502_104277 [Citrobacter amalonaticus]
MSVTRYDVNGPSSVFEDVNGSLVDFKDYAALEDKRAALAAELKQSKIDADCYKKGMEASNARLVQIAAELSAIDAIHNDAVFITDAHYEQCPPEAQKIIGALAVLQIPAYQSFLVEVRAQAQSEVIEWLNAEITAIDTMYRGDPSYEHDAYWMKSNVLDVVELARKAFAAQLRKGVQS